MEAHGTGTKLGDPIELEALTASFQKHTSRKDYCALGSVKSNIGHCMWAAGVAGVLKLVLALKHRQLPPTINFERLNEHINLSDSPFYVNTRLQEWNVGGRETRRAAISSFGLSGTNAHMVLSEYVPPPDVRPAVRIGPQNTKSIVPLSARRPEQLEQKARDLLAFVRNNGSPIDLVELAYTLQVGREPMEERLGFVVSSVEELAGKLEAYIEGKTSIDEFHGGQVKRSRESMSIISQDDDLRETMVAKWIATGKLSKLLDLWVKGLDLDWNALYGEVKPQRITVPTYPFAKERYWIDTTVVRQSAPNDVTTAVLHPLLHSNTSDLSQQRYTSTFSGAEFFLAGHQLEVEGGARQKVLPGVAYLEMARAAVEQALPERPEATVLELHNTVWAQPVVVSESRQVSITLSAGDGDRIDYKVSSRTADQAIVHCQGRAILSRHTAPARLDLEHLRGEMTQDVVEPATVYRVCERMGLLYGPAFQAVTAIHRGHGQVLAQLRLPRSVDRGAGDYVLHPSLMDGALQASIALSDGWSEGSPQPRLPFELESVRIVAPCTREMVAWVRYAPGSQAGDRVVKLDIDLCDAHGRVCVAMKGFASRVLQGVLAESRTKELVAATGEPLPDESEVPVGLVTFAPVWEPVKVEARDLDPEAGQRVVVIGGDGLLHRELWDAYPGAEVLDVDGRTTVEEIAGKLSGARRIDHLVWVLPAPKDRSGASDSFIDDQERGLLLGFRLIKALLLEGYGAERLAWTVITSQTQRLGTNREQDVDPAHSSVHGLVGSMAKEYPAWKVRLADIGRGVWPWRELLRLGWDERGDGWAYREGQWYRRRLAECLGKSDRASGGYTQRGVYVVIGGAGGVGEVLTDYLIRTYDARVAWIGRREKDEAIEEKLERLAAGGGERPLYIAADARNREELERACEEIKERYGSINGVIHSAIVLADKSLANMTEEQFRAVLSAKVDVSVRLAQVFGREPLDFILYFSSFQSFTKAAGQSNYAAGCTFTDSFAEWQAAHVPYAVKVMNWGYWGSVGIVAGAEYQERMAQAGLGSIEPDEGMLAVEQLLAGPLAQMAVVKITRAEAMAKLQPGEPVQVVVREATPVLHRLAATGAVAPSEQLIENGRRSEELDALLAELLLAQMSSLGAFAGEPIGEWRRKTGVPELNARWVDESIAALAARGYLDRAGEGWRVKEGAPSDPEAAWRKWDGWAQRAEERGQSARTRVVDATLRALPAILRGQRLATEVLFPNASMELVEGIYKDNAIADHFNDALAAMVAEYVDERRKQDPGAKLRILEIGAGTGGSSASIFRKLAGREDWIEEYTYTDMSKAFLLHAEQEYGNGRPWLQCCVFDVEQPVPGQAIEAGSYDVVVAGNVLHATRNIRQTVRNSKAALKRHGILLLNEFTANSMFLHLTFGLTEGWWRFEDAELRLPGCPGLSAESWRELLQSEGLGPVLFPAHAAAALGQQIIAAESDGVIRRASRPASKSFSAKSSALVETRRVESPKRVPAVRPNAHAMSGEMIERHVRVMVRESIAEALRIEEGRIQDDRSFSDYGVDSIIAVKLVNRISQQCGVTLPVTVVFDHNNVEQLVRYLTLEHRASVLTMLQGEGAGAADGDDVVEEAPIRVALGPKRTFRSLESDELTAPAAGDDRVEAIRATGAGIYRRFIVERPGSIGDVRWVESEVTPLQPDEVRIAVRAFSLNFGDLLCVKGLYPTMPPFPFTPGLEVSGTVVGVGDGVTRFAVGADVIALMGDMGGHATLATCREWQVFDKPATLGFDEACSLLAVGITMMDAFRKAQLRRGEKILIQTAAGGTGLIAVQLAQHAGAEIYATAGASHKLDYLRTLGVRNAINYRELDFEEEIRRMTGGRGVDVVINTLPGDAIQKGLNCLSPGGRYVEIAMTALKSAKNIDLSVLSNNQAFYSVDLLRLARTSPDLVGEYCRELMALVERGVVQPTVSDAVEFPRIQEAYRRLENRDNIGKVVVTIPEAYRYRDTALTEPRAGAVASGSAPSRKEPIAIVGMSGRFGTANNVAQLWESLARGEDLTEELSRWPDTPRAAELCPRGGFLQEIDRFDPLFFNISGVEATYMDPQQRLFLEEAWKALEDAGYAGAVLEGRQCGVYVGCAAGDYGQLFDGEVPPQAFWGNAGSVIPARIAYYLNLQGAAVAVDTACSSSLVAIHLACQGLWSGEVEMGLAGGVFLQCTPDFHLASGGAGMLSASGRCHAFDDRADGFVPGEGVGVIVLKRLRDAIADGDHIYGVVRGSGINQDGATNGITAPSAVSQERLERHIYDSFNIHPEEIQMVEAHGTGTKLGDPVEYRALTRSFRKDTDKKNYCAIGSIKTNIGHTASAAGVAGVIKALLSLQHRQIPPSLNYEKGNSHIEFDDSPFYVNTGLKEWAVEGDLRRCAAVSSFAFSGTNAHLVIEEAPPPERRRRERPGYLIALSGRTAEQLRQQVERLVRHVDQNQLEDCGDISFTLLLGRKHWNHRLTCVVRSSAELLGALQRWLDKGYAPQVSVFHIQENDRHEKSSLRDYGLQCIEECRKSVEPAGYLERLTAIGELFGQGYLLPLERLFTRDDYRRISLPTYPFARERYWVPVNEKPARSTREVTRGITQLHPLLHENTSDLAGQSYRAELSGKEFFLNDHVVQGRKILPGVVYLEMARAAVAQASAGRPESAVLELHDTVWSQPIVVAGNKQISIALLANEDDEVEYEITSRDGEEEIVHCQGRAVWSFEPEPERLDLEQLESLMGDGDLDSSSMYATCARMGLVYGPSLQAITSIYRGENQLLARLRLPAGVEEHAGDYVLHPSLMDGALQACLALVDPTRPLLPFALDSLRISAPCTREMVAWVRYARDGRTGNRVVKLDVDLCDAQGRVCVRMQGFAARESFPENERLLTLAPVWQAVQPDLGATTPRSGERVVVVGASEEQRAALSQLCAGAEAVGLDGRSTVEEISATLRGDRRIDHLIWVLPRAKDRSGESEGFIEEQGEGSLLGFRLVKALLREGYGAEALAWTVVTSETQSIGRNRGENVDPAHGSVHGLVGSVAKEYSNWKVRLVDTAGAVWPWGELLRLGFDERGDGWAYREGEWYRQQLAQCVIGERETAAGGFKQRGVYVVIGGAGGVGGVLSEYLSSRYNARVAWIGRREQDAAIEQKLDRIAAAGGERPLYIVADARKREELERAAEEIRRRFGPIDGVIHSAIVLADKSLAEMAEEQFRAGLSAKVDVAVRIAQVFGRDPLEFVLYCSSVQSFVKAPVQSNYAAGCTFADAFAQWQSANTQHTAKVMNWGYWGSVGVVAGAEYQERMAHAGLGSIEAPEGMLALEQLLAGPLAQMALVKITSADAMAKLQPGAPLHVVVREAASVLEKLDEAQAVQTSHDLVRNRREEEELDRLSGQLLLAQLSSMGLFAGQPIASSALNPAWLDESLRMLAMRGLLVPAGEGWTVADGVAADVQAAWEEWDQWKQGALEGGEGAKVRLVDATMRALPELLRGERTATDVLFPNAGMELVEGIYKNNAVADFFNEALANLVAAYVAERVKQNRGVKLRLLEIGAGTGGSSAAIFRKLAALEEHIEEYAYTDVSKAFLLHAEQQYGSNRYLKCALLDVEQPLSPQGIETGGYDVVIACNVLHATRNICATLLNSKAALKRHGILLLNELTAKSLFLHLTFGLTDGWWKFEDAALRLPGCPGLSAEGWQRVLQSEGFGLVRFPAHAASALGQQIIAAESDGVLRTVDAIRPPAPVPVAVRPIASATVAAAPAPESLPEKTQDFLRRECSELLRLPSHQIDPHARLETYGIDSILVMKLTTQLEKTFGPLSKTLFFEYQTIRELSDYFIRSHPERLATLFAAAVPDDRRPEPVETRLETRRPAQPRRMSSRRFSAAPRVTTEAEPIAIVGLSGRYPDAVNVEAFWQNLREGKDSITEVPKDRWDWREYFSEDRTESGRHYSKRGGFISGVDEFDPLFFNIAPKEAKSIDPQERLFLQHAWTAIEDAGYTRASLQVADAQDQPGQVGVYAGVMYLEYQLLGASAGAQGRWLGIPGSMASIANRVSYTLNLHGPSVTLDTMCSSSLTAIHFACQDLKLGRTSLAIAGGVNVSIHPNKYLVLSAGQFVSTDGHCQSFGHGGDGFIPAEGVGVVVLKRLSDAQRDGDHIYGTIRGSALNHGGRTNGYTVPSPQAQTSAIRRALAESNTDPRHVSYIEAHGTGTRLGDPIEIAALSNAFQQQTQDTGFCRIGSVKSNIGHCESAAGVAGLTKVLLQMQHQQLVPSLHSAELNPHIDFASGPFIVNQTLRPWDQPVIDGRTLPRIAGISSFGAGGSNAHLIVEEYQQPVRERPAFAPVVIVLSARTAAQLQQQARELLAFLLPRLDTIDLVAMAYTLQVGREAMDERLGIVASSPQQLAEKLQAYVAGQQGLEDVYSGEVKRNKEALSVFGTDTELQRAVDTWIADRKLSRLLDLWVKGLELDWRKLYGDATPPRISLPTYPFAREHYWIDIAPSVPVPSTRAAAVLHPLLHSNTSNLSQQSYSSTFSGDELLMLSAAEYLEMARAAVHHATGNTDGALIELQDVVWTQPVALTGGREIKIALLPHSAGETAFEIYSRDADEELVHCQGRALLRREPAPPRLDLAAIGQGSGQLLAQLRLPSTVAGEPGQFVLHPSLVDAALQAAVELMDHRTGSLVAFAMESLRIVAPCTSDLAAWVRYSAGSGAADGVVKLDLDLCDANGNICAQMRGVSWQSASLDTSTVAPSAPMRREIGLVFAGGERKKAAPVALSAPGAVVASGRSAGRASITLATTAVPVPGHESATPEVPSVRLYDDGNGRFSIEITPTSASGHVIGQLLQALEKVQQEEDGKVLLLRGLERGFARAGREEYNDAVEQKLYQAIVAFPCPVIAVLQDDTNGAAFLAAALCDFMVCNEAATYGYTDVQAQLYPTTPVAMLFGERFGDVLAQDFLYARDNWTGEQLRAAGWTCPIVPATEVEPHAQMLASTLASKSREALRLLKQHLTRGLPALVDALTPGEAATVATDAASGGTIVSPAADILVETPVEHVLLVRLGAAAGKDLAAHLGDILARIRENGSYRAVVLAAEGSDFLAEVPEELLRDVQRVIVASELPVVAALSGNARGGAWLTALLCDATVYSRQGTYSAGRIAQAAAAVFAYRFGNEAASEILLTAGEYSAAELQQRAATVTVEDHDQVLTAAVQVAASWARLPRPALVSWKQHTSATFMEKIRSLDEPVPEGDALDRATPGAIPLQSNVVTATVHPDGIVVVKMEDREAKNMFSGAFMDGLNEVFAHIAQTPAYKVVILTGYDSYFASGGTKEGLLAIQAGQARFTDTTVFRSALDCKLPVIAAMQGHGIGAGWTLGMFADVVLLSEESRYVSPYMDYGFTPGAGATWIMADRLGQDLSRESLLTAQHYTGRELKQRGVRLRILPRAEVDAAAMALAKQIAQGSRTRSIALKQQLTAHVHQPLEATFQRELAMHDATFVGHSETLTKIHDNFYQETEAPPALQQVAPASVAIGDALPDVTATLRQLLANELQMRESDIHDDTQFVDLGLDSIAGVTWIRKINEKYRTSIEATKVYSYPTLAQLSRYVRAEAEAHGTLASGSATTLVVAAKTIPVQKQAATKRPTEKLTSWRTPASSRFAAGVAEPSSSQPIAIIGMAGQFPQANNLDVFWRNIAEGRDCITEVPRERWDPDAYYQPGDAVPGKTNSKWFGALDEYDRFDPLFFNIAPAEAESMDPQQRLFLQECWRSIENAGYDPRSLSGTRCGVFVGCAFGDYHLLTREQQLSGQSFTGDATSILAARASYFLNLHGPCLSIDTACSSSLVAIASACDSLTSGSSDLALAGGVYVMAGPEMHIRTAQVGMLSPEGRCFTFDERADGLVPGEGVGVVMLKRLADAERDGDIIYGVIQGWGVNQDGKTNGITAPNPESQTRLEQAVYDRYAIDPADIQLIEAHGTGTKMGDPIEVEGLKQAFKKYTQNKAYCALGSLKSNIGHCLTAAGVAGVLKVVLALKHRQLPPTIHFERLNEHIDLTDSPFFVNGRLQEWQPGNGGKRQAAISSFGFSGTNAHVVIGEYQPAAHVARPVSVVSPDSNVIIPLSARTPEQLQQRAVDLLSFLRNEPNVDLTSVAYTLQAGRTAMDERMGFVVSSVEQLLEKLEAVVAGERELAGFHRGRLTRTNDPLSIISQSDDIKAAIVDNWVANRKLSNLLELWTKGLELDWSKLYGAVKPQRVALPTYPFAKERYWIDTAASGPAPAAVRRNFIHPLLHVDSSRAGQQSYSATFSGDEFFLSDHQVRTDGGAVQKVLPGVAYLEMARAAVEQAWPDRPATDVELRGVVWVQPVVVSRNRRVSITLVASDRDELDFVIHSEDGGQELVHCRGRAAISAEAAPQGIDLEQLADEMWREQTEPASVYATFTGMGLLYGPAFQGITAIQPGTEQALAQLRLPDLVEHTSADYVLHPSLLDSALQACVGLLDGADQDLDEPRLPFALDSLRIFAPCSREMVAWVRYSPGSSPGDAVVKLDIDLCDARGDVCVQMHGFASRILTRDVKPAHAARIPIVDPVDPADDAAVFDRAFYEKLIADVANRDVSVHDAVEAG